MYIHYFDWAMASISFLLTFTRPGTESSKHFMVVFGMVHSDILGISKSQLTNSLHHFSEG